MTEPQSGATPPSPAGDEGDTRTVAQVEAEYQARISGKDRAHAAQTKSLQDQLAALSTGTTTTEAEAARLKAENATLKGDLDAERKTSALASRKSQFPQATADLDDDDIASMSEAALTKMETRLAGTTPPPVPTGNGTPASLVLPNTAGRPTGKEPPREKTSDELVAQMMGLPYP